MKRISADVAVIGSGLAGLIAAIKCKETAADLEIVLCSKSPPGLANCTAVSQGAFRSVTEGYSPENFSRETLEVGFYMNNTRMLQVMIANVEKDLDYLEKLGVVMKRGRDKYSTTCEDLWREGIAITNPLREHALSLGIKVLCPFFAWDLITNDKKISGIWGFSGSKFEPAVIAAPAVVLAAGGAGALYSRSDNPPGITGDGYALAYRAGLPLMAMEFVQFYPLGTAYPGKPARFLPPILADAGKFINSEGEDIVEKHGIKKTPLAEASRDTLSRAMVLEVAEGRGVDGAIKLEFNFKDGSWGKLKTMFGSSAVEKYKSWTRDFLGGAGYLPVLPVAHFFCGGVPTDERCRTDLEGLFAAGEVTGGLHGANRLGGNALTEALVFGVIAGEEAAAFALQGAPGQDAVNIDEKIIVEKVREIFPGAGSGSGIEEVAQVRKELARTMWEQVGPVRREESLLEAKEKIKSLKESFRPGTESKELRKQLEVLNLILTAGKIIDAALIRKESRGCHYRADYPHTTSRWNSHIFMSRQYQ